MKHNIASFEVEIVQQLLISELCFETCKLTPGFPGLGSHFLPYFYNLSYQRGIDSLHSLLLSRELNELSFKNYIVLHKQTQSSKDIGAIEEKVKQIAEHFKTLASFSLRNKVVSHLDGDFVHRDFTNGYLMPTTLDDLIGITQELKEVFFPFVNHSLGDDPHMRLRGQIREIIGKLTIEQVKKLHRK
jgi:hypothetical protein